MVISIPPSLWFTTQNTSLKKIIVFHLWTITHYAHHQLATAMNLDISQLKLDIEHGKKRLSKRMDFFHISMSVHVINTSTFVMVN